MTCLVCSEKLRDVGGFYRCDPCGYMYPPDIFAIVDDDDWARIQSKGLACTRCPGALPGLPRVHVNWRGRAVRHRWWRKVRP